MLNLERTTLRRYHLSTRKAVPPCCRAISFVVVIFIAVLGVTRNPSNSLLPMSIKTLARSMSTQHGYVNVLFYNSGYLDFVKSWTCNVKLVDSTAFDRTIFIASDQAAADKLRIFAPNAHVHSMGSASADSLSYGTYAYFKLTLDRLRVQSEFLQAGAHVFLIEADATWLCPISDYMTGLVQKEKLISADDRGRHIPLISAGFLFFPSTLHRFFSGYVNKYAYILTKYENFEGTFADKDPGEQHLMTKLIKKARLDVIWLDECQFARGEWYSDKDFRTRCPHPKVIQNNYIAGNDKKKERAKQWGHWFLNDDNTCVKRLPVIDPMGEYQKTCEEALSLVSEKEAIKTQSWRIFLNIR